AWNTEDGRSSTRCRLASPFLTASLFVPPEPLREGRRGTVVRLEYGAAWRTPGGGDGAVGEDPVASSGSHFSVYVTLEVRLLNSGRARAGWRRRGSRRGPHSKQWFPFFSPFRLSRSEGGDRENWVLDVAEGQ
ncbi:hypothetical protein Taro_055928, partial [Colocasia esculenta]|nr:hypothetical protein [Colocasia esculenta]